MVPKYQSLTHHNHQDACYVQMPRLHTGQQNENPQDGGTLSCPSSLQGPEELRMDHLGASGRPCDRPMHTVGPPETHDEVSSLFRPVILNLGYTLKPQANISAPWGGNQTSEFFIYLFFFNFPRDSTVQPTLRKLAGCSGSQSEVPGPVALISPGNQLEMQIVRPAPGFLDQTLGRAG